MSIHKECGAHVRWARMLDNPLKWLPPLELDGERFILTKNEQDEPVASEVLVYKIHNCDPAEMLAWQEYKARLAELRGADVEVDGMSDRQIANEKLNEEQWALALQFDCEKCGAPVNQKCNNISILNRTGECVPTRWPHPERTKGLNG